jgi:4-aminobutyrate aminotransferase-like enzyme/Ser/Thr protein kinase RdoA (MazF antagonist)
VSHGGPQLSADEVIALVRQEYGLTVVRQAALGGETDQNLRLETADGGTYVLKVSAGTPDDPERTWHSQVLLHLQDAAPHIALPRSVPSTSGQHLVAVDPLNGHNSGPAVTRLLTWVDGTMLVDVKHHPPELLRDLGRTAAQLTDALGDIEPPLDLPTHHWDLRSTPSAIADGLPFVEDPTHRGQVERVLRWFAEAESRFAGLPRGVVHHDVNDFNVLVADRGDGPAIGGVLDVGDTIQTLRVAEVAVSVAYAMLRKDDPLAAACEVVAGFDSVVRLEDGELAVIFPLAAARLATNAVTWTRRVAEADTAYGAQRMAHTWPALERIVAILPAYAEAALRLACGRPGSPPADALAGRLAPTVRIDLGLRELGVGPDDDAYDWEQARRDGRFVRHLAAVMGRAGVRRVGVDGPATHLLGTGLLLPPGTGVRSPADAVVESDGEVLVLRHETTTDGSEPCWTRWHGLTITPVTGTTVAAGEHVGYVGEEVPGEVAVQVQVLADPVLAHSDVPRWVRAHEVAVWASLSPDPAPLLGLTPTVESHPSVAGVLATREAHLASSQRSYYARPMKLVRGDGVWIYDESALGYLDSVNNVTHVGHAEPRVAASAARQLGRLNTNSRFVYESMARYAERLTATLPEGLDVVFLVCTGSEANDLALRIARQVTGRQDVVVIDGAYHGNTTAVTGISPNRYKGKGGGGRPPTTHEAPMPDRYRGVHGYHDPGAGAAYGAGVRDVVERLVTEDRPPAAFIAESLMGTAGCIELPQGYLRTAFAAVRDRGGLCISDEVQVGLGRLGSAFWGFQLQGVVPDIVTMGKPLGNGYPLAAVVTTREIADAFDNGAKYFNTFGGSPVACAVGETVLSIVQDDGLQQHAAEVGAYFLEQLQDLASRQPAIGEVRGHGLYLGVDLVSDPAARTPDSARAYAVAERMKDDGVIAYPTGAWDNVLKIKPPMVFDRSHVDLYTATLDSALRWYSEGPL